MGRVRVMNEGDLAMILKWRNHPKIRKSMYRQEEILFKDHAAWFANASNDKKLHLLVFEEAGVASGFISLKLYSWGNIADWGFYVAPDSAKGTGYKLGVAALNYAFNSLKLHKVCGQVISYNEASLGFHKKLGFSREGVLRQQYKRDEKYFDIVHFGILANEWDNLR